MSKRSRVHWNLGRLFYAVLPHSYIVDLRSRRNIQHSSQISINARRVGDSNGIIFSRKIFITRIKSRTSIYFCITERGLNSDTNFYIHDSAERCEVTCLFRRLTKFADAIFPIFSTWHNRVQSTTFASSHVSRKRTLSIVFPSRCDSRYRDIIATRTRNVNIESRRSALAFCSFTRRALSGHTRSVREENSGGA